MLFDQYPPKFSHVGYDPTGKKGLPDKQISSLVEDYAGNFWLGTSKSVIHWNRKTGKFTPFQGNPKISASIRKTSRCWNVFADKKGKIWFTSEDYGIDRLDSVAGNLKSYRHIPADKKSLTSDYTIAIISDKDDTIWIGTDKGLNRYDPDLDRFDRFYIDPSKPENPLNNIITIIEDRNGFLWTGSWYGGLSRFDKTKGQFIKSYRYKPNDTNSISSNTVNVIYERQDGRFWVGTSNGISLFDPETEKFKHFTEEDGLPNNYVKGILEDDTKRLWISTNKGLALFNPETKNFRNYDISDGLHSNQFIKGSYTKGSSGEFFFGGMNGFSYFYPERVKDNPYIPPIHITDFQLFNKSVPIGPGSILTRAIWSTDRIVLSHKQNIFSLEFASLSYRFPEKNRYRYKLEGLDKNWNEVDSNRRYVTYTHLDPGEYDFRVQGSNNDGVWNEKGASLTINILPPWWQTWWAWMLYALSGVLLFYGVVRLRLRASERQRLLLQEEVDVRTAELRKLSQATENSPASVVVTDKNGTIEYVNPTFSEVTGYSADEAIGQNPKILKSGNLSEQYYKELWDTILSGRVWRGEFRNKRKNGEEFWESASISPIMDEDGEITHFVAVKQDTTERKRMEREIITAKENAEEATRAKSDFLANMSHEIRTPMNAVIGMSHLALKTELTPKQQDYLNKIQSSANSLLGIINDILDFSKIEAGKLDMESVEFNLDDVLDNLANLVTVKAQEKEDLEVLFATGQEVPRFLLGDPLRLGQVLINLANNAVKFTDSGEIVVSTELLEQAETGLTIKFSVRDTGIGLTEEQIGKLFQSFSQADTSTTRKFGGTGLGLTISKRLVNMMDGEIWVESKPGQGTTFSFTAKFGLGEEKVKKRLLPSSDLRGMKVLVVDDSATSRNILQDILESIFFEVTLAASAEEGLEEIQKADTDQPYELVLMDWKMPGMDGLEASEHIKNHQTLSKIPAIILVTAYGREEIMQQAEQIGLDGFLIKPVSPSVLFDTIMHAFGEGIPKTSQIAERNKEIEDLKDIQGAQVLLVEDNEINQQVALEILQGAGLNVTVANDGQKAVNSVKASYYDVVLMDIQMPVMDGYTASREIRNLKSEIRNLPIIAMTAHAMVGDKQRSLEAGMNDHVTKPIDPDQLFATLQKWIKPVAERTVVLKSLPATGGPPVLDAPPKPDRAVPDENELPESLPGFDIAAGLERLMGNKRLYRKLLLDFGANYSGVAGEIWETLVAKDFEQAHSLVHNLKGLSGNLEATDLQVAAVEMEKLVRGQTAKTISDKELKLKFVELEHAIQHALDAVQTLGPAADKKALASKEAIASVPPELIQKVTEGIKTAVELGDVMQIISIAEGLKPESDAVAPLCDELIRLADDFDFDSIQKFMLELDR